MGLMSRYNGNLLRMIEGGMWSRRTAGLAHNHGMCQRRAEFVCYTRTGTHVR